VEVRSGEMLLVLQLKSNHPRIGNL
jgi:hypothetical protein